MDMYEARFHAVRIEVEPGHNFPNEVYRHTRDFILNELHKAT